MSESKYVPPKEGLVDYAHTGVKALLSLIPGAGGPAVELFAAIVVPPYQKRQREWMEQVGEGIRLLEATGLNVDELKGKEDFVDSLLQATQSAQRTSNQERREALLNAVLNSALPHAPEESKRQIFIHLLDSLSVWHLRMLRFFNDPHGWCKEHGTQPKQAVMTSNLDQVLTYTFPELMGKRAFMDKVFGDLQNEGLVSGSGSVDQTLRMMMSPSGPYESRTTQMGRELAEFINSPLVKAT